jgi:uncharacterized protein (TIGR02118 family)
MYHVVFLVKRKAGMSQEAFADYWINQHTPITARVPGLREYRCYPAIGSADDRDPPFDAVAICAFDDEAACRAAMASDEMAAAGADAVNFQTVDGTFGFFATEYKIV